MKLLIKFPTRNRPEKFINSLNKYIDFLEDKSTQIVVSCDVDDLTMQTQHVRNQMAEHENVEVIYSNNKSKIEAVNSNLDLYDFDILLLASDDMIPEIKGFDQIIIEKMKIHYPDTDGVLWFNDGYQEDKLNTLCILGKKYFDRFNYIYNPNYLSVWCDNEFMEVANILKKQTYFNEVIIRHEHPDWGFGNQDEIHMLNSNNEMHDRLLFYKRKEVNFNLT
jgi:hypothetical protein